MAFFDEADTDLTPEEEEAAITLAEAITGREDEVGRAIRKVLKEEES